MEIFEEKLGSWAFFLALRPALNFDLLYCKRKSFQNFWQ